MVLQKRKVKQFHIGIKSARGRAVEVRRLENTKYLAVSRASKFSNGNYLNTILNERFMTIYDFK